MGLAGLGLLPACQTEGGRQPQARTSILSRTDPNRPFLHGVASGDPLPDGVILWTRVNGLSADTPITWQVYGDAQRNILLASGTTIATPRRNGCVKVDVRGLQPDQRYFYDFVLADGPRSDLGRTRTAPVHERPVKVALATCSYFGGYFNAYARMAERESIDLVLHLGDYIYEGAPATGERADPNPAETTTLEDYRARYAHYRQDADLQALHAAHPMISVWDDHEFTNDAWQNGAQNHTEGAEGNWEQRKAWARQAYFEWMPVREQADGRLYRQLNFGPLVDIFMLDGRIQGRSQQVSPNPGPLAALDPRLNDPNRTMLGFEQEDWLYNGLINSQAHWKLIGNQTMLGHLNESTGFGPFRQPINNWLDQWDGYPPARQRLYDILAGRQGQAIDNVLVATGDWHNSFAMDLPANPLSGYAPQTGDGSLAVEFVTPSITSGFFNVDEAGLADFSPHIKHHQNQRHGFVVLTIAPQRTVAEEFWINTVAMPDTAIERGLGFEVLSHSNRLQRL